MRRYLPFAIIGAVLLIGSGSALLLYRSKHSSTPLKVAAGKPGAEPSHVRGPADARVTLEEFGDFQCPPCGLLATTLLKIEHDYATNVRVVFREFPLSSAHAHAFTAACAAEAAGLQGRFWEMHDKLFEHATYWSKEHPPPIILDVPRVAPNASSPEAARAVREIFAGYARTLELDVERFMKDMDAEQVNARIKADQERGASLGVDRTPILFVDGVSIPFSSFPEKELRGVIDAALSGKPPAPPAPSPTPTPPQ
jgi:protein-disulfide isomerase